MRRSQCSSGLKVALAKIGACLPGDFKIKESKLRGELSQGMLCSVSELGIEEDSEGIMELEEDAPIGMNLRDYLLLDDYVLEVDLTPNRADCFSVKGIAREVAALNHTALIEPSIPAINPDIDDVVPVTLKNPEACSHYCGRIIRNIKQDAVTPLWMAERLRRSGIRVIHPVVDIMNYVMLELGQPMHAFDLNTVQGGIEVRFARASESLELLDGQNISLSDKVLIIADETKPLAIAGVMGGLDSSVQVETQDLFLESAFFNPISIAGVARAHGLFSDSSQRFERGVDPNIQIKALERATALILAIAGGRAGPIIEVSEPKHLPASVSIRFNTSKVEQLTGLCLSTEKMTELLIGLGMMVQTLETDLLQVQVPSHRFDIQYDVDLVEEIIRLYGYDNLPAKP